MARALSRSGSTGWPPAPPRRSSPPPLDDQPAPPGSLPLANAVMPLIPTFAYLLPQAARSWPGGPSLAPAVQARPEPGGHAIEVGTVFVDRRRPAATSGHQCGLGGARESQACPWTQIRRGRRRSGPFLAAGVGEDPLQRRAFSPGAAAPQSLRGYRQGAARQRHRPLARGGQNLLGVSGRGPIRWV